MVLGGLNGTVFVSRWVSEPVCVCVFVRVCVCMHRNQKREMNSNCIGRAPMSGVIVVIQCHRRRGSGRGAGGRGTNMHQPKSICGLELPGLLLVYRVAAAVRCFIVSLQLPKTSV